MRDDRFEVLGLLIVSWSGPLVGRGWLGATDSQGHTRLVEPGRPIPKGTVGLRLEPDLWAIARRLLPALAKRGALML